MWRTHACASYLAALQPVLLLSADMDGFKLLEHVNFELNLPVISAPLPSTMIATSPVNPSVRTAQCMSRNSPSGMQRLRYYSSVCCFASSVAALQYWSLVLSWCVIDRPSDVPQAMLCAWQMAGGRRSDSTQSTQSSLDIRIHVKWIL